MIFLGCWCHRTLLTLQQPKRSMFDLLLLPSFCTLLFLRSQAGFALVPASDSRNRWQYRWLQAHYTLPLSIFSPPSYRFGAGPRNKRDGRVQLLLLTALAVTSKIEALAEGTDQGDRGVSSGRSGRGRVAMAAGCFGEHGAGVKIIVR